MAHDGRPPGGVEVKPLALKGNNDEMLGTIPVAAGAGFEKRDPGVHVLRGDMGDAMSRIGGQRRRIAARASSRRREARRRVSRAFSMRFCRTRLKVTTQSEYFLLSGSR